MRWPLLTAGLALPLAAEIVFLVLAVTISPAWVVALILLPLAPPVQAWAGLLYRNWPTGIRIEADGIRAGAIGSARAERRRPRVTHQAWGLFSCPRSAVLGARVVTDPAEIKALRTGRAYDTLNTHWGSRTHMTHCNLGVLIAPFTRAALVVDVDLGAITAPMARPSRMFGNGLRGSMSRQITPQLSPVWVVPTRHPDALRQALADQRLPV